jgi:hypothetical protein
MNHCQITTPDEKQETCLICQIDFNTTSPSNTCNASNLSKIIDCNHIYHSECIEEWFKYNQSCPICRKNLGKSLQPSLFQFILLYLSLQSPHPYPHQHPQQENDGGLHTYESGSLASTAFVCVFLSILLERYTTAAEYNQAKYRILELRSSLSVENELLPSTVNISSRTAIIREIKHRQTLMRCQLLQWLWATSDPYHLQEPPELPHGRALYGHPYLQTWRINIERAINRLL